jgi:hypothetical protein
MSKFLFLMMLTLENGGRVVLEGFLAPKTASLLKQMGTESRKSRVTSQSSLQQSYSNLKPTTVT